MTKYIQRTDGEGFVVPLEEKYRLACCDCGLVHDVVWVYDETTKELGMAAQRNNRATAQRRKRHQTKPLSDEEITQVLNDENIAEYHQGNWLVLPYAFARAIEAKVRGEK